MMNVPFGELARQYHRMQAEIDEAVGRVLRRGWFVLGEEVAAFECEWADYCGVAYAVGVGNGTDAIALALRALGVNPGDEVITVPFTATFTALAITQIGARPVFVDIDPVSYTLDPAGLEAAITPRTRAIVPVHLYGHCADMAPILEIARRYDLWVVEDAAQAHGATYQGRRAGSLAHAAAFSFYPSKNLGAYGDGGAVTTDDPAVVERVRILRNGGQRARYDHVLTGINSRLDELQAAILRVKLRHLAADNAARRERAAWYSELLADTGLILPVERPGREHVWHLYVVQTPQREALQRHLAERGVGTQVHYPTPVHLQEAYHALGLGPGRFPISERCASQVLSLPMYPELTWAEVKTVAEAIRSFGS